MVDELTRPTVPISGDVGSVKVLPADVFVGHVASQALRPSSDFRDVDGPGYCITRYYYYSEVW